MKIEMAELLKLSSRICGAITFACLLILFFPEKLLPFAIEEFRENNGVWIFIVFATSTALLLSYFFVWIGRFISNKCKNKQQIKKRFRIMENLNDDEFEKVYLLYKKTTCEFYVGSVSIENLARNNIIQVTTVTAH